MIRYRCERVPGLQPLGGPAHAPCPQCRRLTLDEQAEVVAGLFLEAQARLREEMTETAVGDDQFWVAPPDERELVAAVVRELLERKVIE